MANDWFWAVSNDGTPACDRFVIANGKEALWSRVRLEVDPGEKCAWMPLHRGCTPLEGVMFVLMSVVPTYGVSHNRFVFEAAQIPDAARFMRKISDPCNFVSNPVSAPAPVEPYSEANRIRLHQIINRTLGTDDPLD